MKFEIINNAKEDLNALQNLLYSVNLISLDKKDSFSVLSKEEKEYFELCRNMFQNEKLDYIVDYLMHTFSYNFLFGIFTIFLIDRDNQKVSILTVPPFYKCISRKILNVQFCIYKSKEEGKQFIIMLKDLDEYKNLLFKLTDEVKMKCNTNYQLMRFYEKSRYGFLLLSSRVLDIDNDICFNALIQSFMRKSSLEGNQSIRKEENPIDVEQEVVTNFESSFQEPTNTGFYKLKHRNHSENTPYSNYTIYQSALSRSNTMDTIASGNYACTRANLNRMSLNEKGNGESLVDEMKTLNIDGEATAKINEGDTTKIVAEDEIESDDYDDVFLEPTKSSQPKEAIVMVPKPENLSIGLNKHNPVGRNIFFGEESTVLYEEYPKNHNKAPVFFNDNMEGYLSILRKFKKINGITPDELKRISQVKADYPLLIQGNSKQKYIKIPNGNLLYLTHYNIILNEYKKGQKNFTKLLNIVHQLTLSLEYRSTKFLNLSSFFINHTNKHLKRYRSKIDRFYNYYSYCLVSNNNDNFYQNLFSNVLDEYKKKRKLKGGVLKHSKSDSNISSLSKEDLKKEFEFNFDDLAVFKFFYLKHFICFDESNEYNPIVTLLPDLIKNAFKQFYNIKFQFYSKEFEKIHEIESSINPEYDIEMKNDMLNIIILEKTSDQFEYYIKFDDELDLINTNSTETLTNLIESSLAEYNAFDKISFFETNFNLYFKDSLEEYEIIKSK